MKQHKDTYELNQGYKIEDQTSWSFCHIEEEHTENDILHLWTVIFKHLSK